MPDMTISDTGARGAAVPARPALTIPEHGGPVPRAWDEAERIALWPGTPPGGTFVALERDPSLPPTFLTGIAAPELRLFQPLPGMGNGRALLVIPGGGYGFVSIRNEGADVAALFTAAGYTVFVLVHRLPGEGWSPRETAPLADARRAMRVIAAQASRLAFDPQAVAVIGFSAGGHLAATLLTAPALPDDAGVGDAIDQLMPRARCAALLYPVTTLDGAHAHGGSAEALLGPTPDPAMRAALSPVERIAPDTPPLFIAHALDDAIVPAANALELFTAMRAANRPVELHLHEEGGHGFGIGPADAPAGLWPLAFLRFLERHMAAARP